MKSLLFFLCLAIANQAGAWTNNFGNEGREGLQGQNGLSGRSGQNVLIQANQPGPQSFYLSGEDGTDAGPGQDGDSAYNCQQPPFVDNDLEGADGGDGGAGGSGGSGGDGGDATIYYTDLAQLKRILISSRGGQGGQGAWGGRGGAPCSCAVPSWVIPRCHEVATPDGKKRTVCEDYDRYTCVAGDRGRDGAPGRPGSEGSLGFVTLIKSKTLLLPEALSLQVSLRQFASKKSIDGLLSENLFVRQSGLLSLLAPGSQVSDSYSEFVRRAEEKVRLVWDSKKLATSYAGNISVSINEGEVSFNVTSDEVLLTEERLENGVHTLYIRDAYNLSEFAILGLTLEGQKTGTLIRVKGASPRLDLVEDFVRVKISYKRVLLGYKEVFDGAVPVGALQRAGTDLLVNVGKMRFSSSDDIWNGKKEAKIELQIHRRIKGSDESIARKAVFFTKKK